MAKISIICCGRMPAHCLNCCFDHTLASSTADHVELCMLPSRSQFPCCLKHRHLQSLGAFA